MSDKLPYQKHRKHRYYTQDHPLTAKQRRRVRRLRRIRAQNAREANFGKINWAAYEHQQLWDMVQSSDPAAMGATAHRWAQLAVGVDTATSEVHKTVQKLLLSWRGPSAVRAAQSASKLTAWGADASEKMRKVGEELDTYTSTLLEARNTMPEPIFYSAERHFREGYDVKASSGPSGAILADQLLDDQLPSKRAATQAKAEAVRVMERYEAASKGVHERLPEFTNAPEVVVGDADGTDSGDTVASSVPVGGGPAGAAAAAIGGPPPGGAPALGVNPRPGEAGGLSTGSGAASGGASGAAAASAQGAAASTRGGGWTGAAGVYPPMAGQRGQGEGEHRNRYAEGMGVDFLDDLPPAYPPVFGE